MPLAFSFFVMRVSHPEPSAEKRAREFSKKYARVRFGVLRVRSLRMGS